MNILFDLDGTLTDPFPGITGCIQYSLGELGAPVPPAQDLVWCIGPPLVESFATLLEVPLDSQVLSRAVELYRERFSREGLFENRVYRGIPEVLGELRAQNHWIGLATSKPRVYALRILEHFGLSSFFHGMYGSELDGTHSDKTELIAHLLTDANLDAGNTLMIGDRKHDIVGGRNNGLQTIGVLWGYGSRAELEEAGADQLVERPEEILQILGYTGKR